MKQTSCIFCQISKNTDLVSERLLFNEKDYFVMLSLHPQISGHALLVPKTHFRALEEIPNQMQGFLFQQTIQMAKMIKNLLGAKAYLIKVNNELYQLEKDNKLHIGHIHFHIIPRYKAGEKLSEQPKKATKKELLVVKEQIMKDIGTIKEL